MTILAVLGLLLFYAISLQAALIAMREPRWGRRAHALVWAAGSFTVGSLCLALFSYYYDAESPIGTLATAGKTLTITALILSASGFIAWVIFLLLRHSAIKQGATPHHRISIRKRLRYIYRLAQPNWRELSSPNFTAADQRSASRSTTIIGFSVAAIAIPAVFLLLAASILMNIRGSVTSDFAARTLEYYTLLIATCWTISYLTTLALLAIQQVLRDQGRDLSPAQVVLSVGTWAGFGAAGGVFVGALIPAVVIIIPKGPFQSLDLTLLDTISPNLLLNISASGAVIGFLLGEVISVISFAEGEKDLFVKTVLPPTIFAASATILGAVGLRPGAISAHLSRQYAQDALKGHANVPNPFTTAANADLDTSSGWASLIVSFDQHGWNTLVDTRFYFVGTWVVALLVIAFGFTFRIHKRELSLAADDLSQETREGKSKTISGNSSEQ